MPSAVYTDWDVVAFEQPTAAKWQDLGDNDRYFAELLVPSVADAPTDWTPTYTNITATSGTDDSKYLQFGKLVVARLAFTLGASSAVGSGAYFTLPITSITHYVDEGLGDISLYDASGTAGYGGTITWRDTGTAFIRVKQQSGNGILNSGTTVSIPFPANWTNPDRIAGMFSYFAA